MAQITVKELLSTARAELGYQESPANSNKTKYGEWFGLNGQPWCMMFVQWCFHRVGGYEMLPAHTASCGALMRAAQATGSWVTGDYQPGDVVILNFHGAKKQTDHCGIVWELADGGVMTIEGNTGTTSEANGGEVMARVRSNSLILGAWRPQWKEVETVSINNNIPDEYAKEAVAWAQENGILLGDTSGNLDLHQPCTRQHVIVWLWRLWKLLRK